MNTHVLFSGLEQSSDSSLWTLGLPLKIRTFHAHLGGGNSSLSVILFPCLLMQLLSELSYLVLNYIYLPDRLIDPLAPGCAPPPGGGEGGGHGRQRVAGDLPLDVASTWVGGSSPGRRSLGGCPSISLCKTAEARADGWCS
ncbi:unnamed protein product [Musa banksii]